MVRGEEVRRKKLPTSKQRHANDRVRAHLDVLLWVLKVLEEHILGPGDSGLLVCAGVGEAFNLARHAAEETVQDWAGGVLGIWSGDTVALKALLLENLCSLFDVSCKRTG